MKALKRSSLNTKLLVNSPGGPRPLLQLAHRRSFWVPQLRKRHIQLIRPLEFNISLHTALDLCCQWWNSPDKSTCHSPVPHPLTSLWIHGVWQSRITHLIIQETKWHQMLMESRLSVNLCDSINKFFLIFFLGCWLCLLGMYRHIHDQSNSTNSFQAQFNFGSIKWYSEISFRYASSPLSI